MFEKLSASSEAPKQLNEQNELVVSDPDGYPVVLRRGDSNKVTHCRWNVQDLAKSTAYWVGVLGLQATAQTERSVDLSFQPTQPKLQLVQLGQPIQHKTGWGRLAFATPTVNLLRLNQLILESPDYHHLHHKQELGTPGKQTVTVIILHDPDQYEICFVNDEDYSILSKVDPDADQTLEKVRNSLAKIVY